MQFQQTLSNALTALNKVIIKNSKQYTLQNQIQQNKAPVTIQVENTLEREKQVIQNLVMKKRNQQQKARRISSANLEYRKNLRQKIEEEQAKHQKKRSEFLAKRVKQERFKSSEVLRKKGEHEEKLKEKAVLNDKEFKSHKSKTIEFWKNHENKTQQKFASQTAVPPLYRNAIQKKINIQDQNIEFSEKTKQELLKRHQKCFNIKKSMFVYEPQPYWEEHRIVSEQNYKKSLELQKDKQAKIINKIGNYQEASSKLVKKNQQDWEKKLKRKLIDEHDKFDKVTTQRKQFLTSRSKSLKECSCHQKGKIPKIQNQQQYYEQDYSNSTSPFKKTSLPLFTRTNFSKKAKINENIVLANKLKIQQIQDDKNDRKLMVEREISEAVRNRKNIYNQSNCLVRTARVNG